MYAVIASGGKQSRVAEGQQVHVELLDAEQFNVKLLALGHSFLLTTGCDHCVHSGWQA